MPTLNIQPVEYSGKKLNDLGERIISEFYPLIDGFIINREITLKELVEEDRRKDLYGRRILEETSIFPPYSVALVDSGFFYFLSKYDTPILSITSLPIINSAHPTDDISKLITIVIPEGLTDTETQKLIEEKLEENIEEGLTTPKLTKYSYFDGFGLDKVAFVSTYRTEFWNIDSEEHIERCAIIGVHEMGHAFGILEHHLEYNKQTSNGKFCAMTTGLLGKIPWEQHISLIAPSFCVDCYKKLGVYK